MAAIEKYRKDKEIVLELEAQIKEIRHGLAEQLRCLDQRLECHSAMAWELHDFYQRRAQVELDHSKNLDKLVKQIMVRHKTDKQKREQWPAYSTYKLWQTLLGVTTKQSRNQSVLSEVYSTFISNKFLSIMDDLQRIYKKCRLNVITAHEDLIKVVSELQSSMKTYHQYHEQSRHAETKLQRVESQKARAVAAAGEQEKKSSAITKRVKNFEKQSEKHITKVQEQNLKALKARNEYRLCIDSANAAIRKFYVDDLPELMNAMDYGYHLSLGQVLMCCVSAEELAIRMEQESATLVSSKAKDLNQRADRQAFLQQSHQIFSLPKKFEFVPHKGDQITELSAEMEVSIELLDRLQSVSERLHSLKLENEELWKTLETTDSSLLDRLMVKDFDVQSLFNVSEKSAMSPTTPTAVIVRTQAEIDKLKAERLETEDYYVQKLSQYHTNSNMIARLQAKYQTMERALSRTADITSLTSRQAGGLSKRPISFISRPTRKRQLGKSALEARPRLFGGSIEEYVQATGQEIPLVIRSCTRIINLYGLHHQGVFRLSGAQHEINEYKNMFERGEEPVLSKFDPKDLNCISGVLKLYFRELREPLFPLQLFDELIACTGPRYDITDVEDLKKCISRIQELLLPLPRSIVVVVRYLFSFLNHLSEYSDENMMDAHNLSVCFGPTLVPIPPDHDQVRYQNAVNDLVRILIVHHESIFPNDGGPVYEKCIVGDDGDLEDSVDSLLEDAISDKTDEESESNSRRSNTAVSTEAVALYDFTSRASKELSFKRGEAILLTTRVNQDWWEGVVNGRAGLVPHKFVAVQTRPSSSSDLDSMHTSTESLPPSHTKHLTSLPTMMTNDPLDRSISQPNILNPLPLLSDDMVDSLPPPPSTPTILASCSSTSSDLSRGGYGSGASDGGAGLDVAGESRGRGGGSFSESLRSSTSGKDMLDDVILGDDCGDTEPLADVLPTQDILVNGTSERVISDDETSIVMTGNDNNLTSLSTQNHLVQGQLMPCQSIPIQPVQSMPGQFMAGQSALDQSISDRSVLVQESLAVSNCKHSEIQLNIESSKSSCTEFIETGSVDIVSFHQIPGNVAKQPGGDPPDIFTNISDLPALPPTDFAPVPESLISANYMTNATPTPAAVVSEPIPAVVISSRTANQPTESYLDLSNRSTSPAMTTAEVFAKPNQGTIKKATRSSPTDTASATDVQSFPAPLVFTEPDVSSGSASIQKPSPAYSSSQISPVTAQQATIDSIAPRPVILPASFPSLSENMSRGDMDFPLPPFIASENTNTSPTIPSPTPPPFPEAVAVKSTKLSDVPALRLVTIPSHFTISPSLLDSTAKARKSLTSVSPSETAIGPGNAPSGGSHPASRGQISDSGGNSAVGPPVSPGVHVLLSDTLEEIDKTLESFRVAQQPSKPATLQSAKHAPLVAKSPLLAPLYAAFSTDASTTHGFDKHQQIQQGIRPTSLHEADKLGGFKTTGDSTHPDVVQTTLSVDESLSESSGAGVVDHKTRPKPPPVMKKPVAKK